jgi:hypothetical protein
MRGLDPGFVRRWYWPNLASSLVQKDAHVILYASMKTSATMHEFFWQLQKSNNG